MTRNPIPFGVLYRSVLKRLTSTSKVLVSCLDLMLLHFQSYFCSLQPPVYYTGVHKTIQVYTKNQLAEQMYTETVYQVYTKLVTNK